MRKFLRITLALALSVSILLTLPSMSLASTPILWSEDFDSYPAGQDLHGVGGWQGWDNDPAVTAYVSNNYSKTVHNSVSIAGVSDLVQPFSGLDWGQWVMTAWQYIPDDFTGYGMFILLNKYEGDGPDTQWSTQITFDAENATVYDYYYGGELPLIKGEWVEIRIEIDLDNDLQSAYYGGDLLYQESWTYDSDGITSLAALDLYSEGSSPVYYDYISLRQILPSAVGGEVSRTSPSTLVRPALAFLALLAAAGALVVVRRRRC